MSFLWHDLRHALRLLRKTPGFSLVAILTLALGIGACTAIYTVVYGVLLRPLPYPDPDRVMQLWQVNPRGGQISFSDPNFEDLQEQNRTFAALAKYGSMTGSVMTDGTSAARISLAWLSRDALAILRVQPVVGRAFVPDEHREGAAPVAIVGYTFWRDQLKGDRDLAHHTVRFDQRTYTVVGVMPPAFRFPADAQLWVPAESLYGRLPSRTAHNWRVIARLRDGVTIDQARADLTTIAQRLRAQYRDDTSMVDAAVVPLHEQLVGRVRRLLLIVLGAVGFLLLVACANVVNLLLTRATTRQRELAVRAALGANRLRLLLPFLTESFVLTLVGCALGIGVAMVGVRALLALEPGNLPRLDDIAVSWPVLGFAIAISMVTAAALGLIAAARAMKADVYSRLKEGQRTMAGGASSARVRDVLVVAQLAVSLVLLIGAALMGRSFVRLMQQDLGFRTERLLTIELLSPFARDAESRVRLTRFHDDLEARLRALPGVTDVGGVNTLPLTGGGADGTFIILDRETPTTADEVRALFKNKERTGQAEFRVATPGYFRAMGIPLMRGRLFDDRDVPEAPHAALITESLAKSRWPDRDPIGLRIEYGNMDGDLTPYTIVGVVGDVRDYGAAARPRPTFYANARQRPRRTAQITMVVQATTDVTALIAPATDIVRALDPDVPPRFRTIEQVFATSLADRRFTLLLLSAFGGAALLLAVIGIYGVMSYVVSQRTQELGVRVALGARSGDIMRLVVGQGARLIVIGLALGLAGAVALTRLLATLLFEVTATDPLTYAGVAIVLAATAMAACQIPAWRATRVDPLTALRAD